MARGAITRRKLPQIDVLKLHADLHILNGVVAFGVGGLLLELIH